MNDQRRELFDHGHNAHDTGSLVQGYRACQPRASPPPREPINPSARVRKWRQPQNDAFDHDDAYDDDDDLGNRQPAHHRTFRRTT